MSRFGYFLVGRIAPPLERIAPVAPERWCETPQVTQTTGAIRSTQRKGGGVVVSFGKQGFFQKHAQKTKKSRRISDIGARFATLFCNVSASPRRHHAGNRRLSSRTEVHDERFPATDNTPTRLSRGTVSTMPASHATISPTPSSTSADGTKGVPMAVAIAIAIVGLVITSATAKAAVIASDNAGNYPSSTTYTQASPPPNNGTGFTWTAASNTTMTIATTGLTSLGSKYFSIPYRAEGSNAIMVNAPGSLSIGDTFSVLLAATDSPTGFMGVGFSNILLERSGGSSFWIFSTNRGVTDSNTTVQFAANTAVTYSLQRTSSSAYTLSLTDGTTSWSQSVTPSSPDSLGFDFYYNAGPTSGNELGFNNLQIQSVPEPSTYAMLIAGGLAMGGAAMRRRRRLVRG